VHTGQHLPPLQLDTDARDWADRTGTGARTAWARFFDRNRTDPGDRGDWGNLTAATGATLNAYTARVGHRTVQATVGRGRYQLTRAEHGLAHARSAAGNALQDMRSRPVRTALAAGGVTLAAATVGAPLVAGATGVVIGRRAVKAIAQRRQTEGPRRQQRDAEVLAIYGQHRYQPHLDTASAAASDEPPESESAAVRAG
jgi:hypothetical protein